jgi:hypothetical protein
METTDLKSGVGTRSEKLQESGSYRVRSRPASAIPEFAYKFQRARGKKFRRKLASCTNKLPLRRRLKNPPNENIFSFPVGGVS